MSLYLRNRSWYYNFTFNGIRYNDCIGPVSKTRAKEIYRKKRVEVAEGVYVSPKKASPRLRDFYPEYIEYYRANRRPRSVERHETSWIAVEPILGKKALDKITPLDLEKYRQIRQKGSRSDTTINRELAFLRNLFNQAIAWGKATTNPLTKVRFARENNQRIRFLTLEEEDRLLAVCSKTLRPIVITAVNTGFRKSELLSLTWEDIDFERRLVTVKAGYAKNGESRSVPMNDMLHTTLEEVKIASPEVVFPSRNGTPYRSFRRTFDTTIRKAEIENFTFHALRHTFASRLVMSGVDLPTVKELMGHKDITMTLRYAHLSSDHKQSAVNALDNFGSRQFSRQVKNGGNTDSSK